MPAIDLVKEWQRAEAACIAAYQAMYSKAQGGGSVSADELERLAKLSRVARESYHRYLEQVTGDDLPKPG